MESQGTCEAGDKCGGSCSAVWQICSGNTMSMQYPQQVTVRSAWLARHCEPLAELALTIAMNLMASNRSSCDSSYHTVDSMQGLAAA
jgi:hypothetical protein